MGALLSKIVGMTLTGVNAGPALVLIPMLLGGALVAAIFTLRNYTEES
jgi:hypothetical protein